MEKLFGTDGMRGEANQFPMTPEVMVKMGVAIGTLLPKRPPGVIIGHDGRLSGQMLEHGLTAGVLASGTPVLSAGLLPTPAIAFLTHTHRAQAGIMISASHNPARDNGIKIFSDDGFKLPDELEYRLEQAVLNADQPLESRPNGAALGTHRHLADGREHYSDHILQSVFADDHPNLQGLHIVVDCANGAASVLAPRVFQRLQAQVTELFAAPDGLNINQQCGALHPERLQTRVVQAQADLGLAFDGDADRLILVDEHGAIVDGDQILAMLALDLAQHQQLVHNTVVATVMSNVGLEIALQTADISLVRTPVGDRHVVEQMRQIGAMLGGEQSGHVVMFQHGTTGDGLVAALAVLRLMSVSGRSLSELAACMRHFPQTLVNIPVSVRRPLAEMEAVQHAMQQAERELGTRGRLLVRYSGTELLARVMVEAEDEQTVTRIAEMVAAPLREAIGRSSG
ncbi:phosphoglucosamine mutase [candidate division KSB3 bacterium]|uniref:Phosphoglucosamine mutase n=1 Tax=candidate division KSB3 bacterium TaxID=2044937 RepID=A0A9D5JVQ3_9BACT|nr:phosphoglucosamine mutase [candidate division KSB3 bacterium]MBD3325024.1 phosphoglucosamine mutase [candidate division KSB3 bacterium]